MEANEQRPDPAEFLFRIGTWAMTIVLGLIFNKIGDGFSVSYSQYNVPVKEWPYMLAILIAMMLVMVGVLASLAYAHSELRVPYLRLYLLWDLLFITMPIYVGIECIHRAAFSPEAMGRGVVDQALFRFAMGGLAVVFVSLFARGLLLLSAIEDQAKRRTSRFFMPFHGVGFMMCCVGCARPDLLTVGAVFALPLSAAYLGILFFVWAGKVSFQPR